MLGLSRRSLRFKLTAALASVAIVTVLSLTAMQAVFEREQLRTRGINETLTTARLLAPQVDSVVLNTEQELAVISADPSLLAEILARDADAVNARLEAIAPRDPDLTTIVAIDADGRVWATSNADKGAIGTDFREQRHVQIALQRGIPGVGVARRDG